ncbi:MAG: cell division protein FtsQ/DivIB [Gammaproteobacteria bacterium]|nr:cell division protein FtsQ/DivIB [Gammaproteobacteria bacterium]
MLDDVGIFKFSSLMIKGEFRHLDPKQIRRMAMPFTENGFMAIDLEGLKNSVESLSWVRKANVRREWPGTLIIEIVEQQPVATWFGDALINANGEIFLEETVGYEGSLPDISGPLGTQSYLLNQFAEIHAELSNAGLGLQSLTLSERRAWSLTLQNGITVKLGRDNTKERIMRFSRVAYTALHDDLPQIAYFDMRYTNGYAVGWKGAPVDMAGTFSGDAPDV